MNPFRIFAYPSMLWLLPVFIAPLSGFLWWAWRKRQQLIAKFISSRLVAQLKVGVSPRRQKARLVMIVLAVTFLILALARPQWGSSQEEVRQKGLDIIVAIDTSNSMLAEDTPPNRLARAKLAALDLMRKAKADRLGLVAFAGSAFLECPLTLDDSAFSQSVNALDTKTFSQGGTAIAEAIEEARKTFKVESENYKVMVLFTDGEDHDSNAIAAARKAAEEGIVIFTVGIGSPEGEVLRIRDERGRVDYIRDEDGKPVTSKLDESLLQEIARSSKGGFYAPLRGSKTMENLYDQGIAPLPKKEGSSHIYRNKTERFQWPLAIAIGFLLLEMFLPERKRGGKKAVAANEFAPSSNATEIAIIIGLLLIPLQGLCGPNAALNEYNKGNYPEALKRYDDLLKSKKDDPRLHFNAGDAAYQSRQLDQAMKEFNESLNSPDIQLQQKAYYNLGNTYFRMGQQAQEPDKKQENWENAIKQFDSALKLNNQDKDAEFNQQFVKKQLEELKKQQSQQQKDQNKDQKDKKDNKDQKDQQQQNQDKQGQDKKDQQNQDQKSQDQKQQQSKDQQDQQKKDAQQQAADKAKEEEKKKQEAAQKKDDKKDEDQQQAASAAQKDQEAKEEEKKEAAMMAAGKMTPKQAAQLLDAQKNDDKVFQFMPTNQPQNLNRNYKNW